jgi:heptosyltransferase-2
VSVSGDVREWLGFRELADVLAVDRPVVFYGGPGEERRVQEVAGRHPVKIGLSLPAFASALNRCALFVSNDSGAAHFARAVGAETLVIFGSTTWTRTGPSGSLAVEGPPLGCRPCYGRRCEIRSPAPCLDIPLARVLGRVELALG